MKLSDIFKFKLFEGSDKANLKIVNENFEIAEKELAATNKEIANKVTDINNRITELNNLLGGKLDVSKIANNLVTTEAGYALDARMGKALSDGKENNLLTKAFEISIEVNENTSISTTFSDQTYIDNAINPYNILLVNVHCSNTETDVPLELVKYYNNGRIHMINHKWTVAQTVIFRFFQK